MIDEDVMDPLSSDEKKEIVYPGGLVASKWSESTNCNRAKKIIMEELKNGAICLDEARRLAKNPDYPRIGIIMAGLMASLGVGLDKVLDVETCRDIVSMGFRRTKIIDREVWDACHRIRRTIGFHKINETVCEELGNPVFDLFLNPMMKRAACDRFLEKQKAIRVENKKKIGIWKRRRMGNIRN